MTLEEQINKDIISAMKEKNDAKRDILRYIKGLVQTEKSSTQSKGKIDDIKVIKIMEKSVAGMREIGDAASLAEISILETYIPQKMSEEDIRSEITSIVDGGASNLGEVMKQFNSKFGGKADNKIVSTVARELL